MDGLSWCKKMHNEPQLWATAELRVKDFAYQEFGRNAS